jgi:hypothetical protein
MALFLATPSSLKTFVDLDLDFWLSLLTLAKVLKWLFHRVDFPAPGGPMKKTTKKVRNKVQ